MFVTRSLTGARLLAVLCFVTWLARGEDTQQKNILRKTDVCKFKQLISLTTAGRGNEEVGVSSAYSISLDHFTDGFTLITSCCTFAELPE
jgi:hypothetical protein